MMNKRELRKHFDPHLQLNRNSGVLYVENNRYVVCTAVKNIEGRRTLLLYVYPTEQASGDIYEPRYTVFQSREDYLALEKLPDGKTKWRTSRMCDLGNGYHYSVMRNSVFYTKKDRERVCRFCGESDGNGFSALETLQERIYIKKALRRQKRKELIIWKRMRPVGKVPQSMQNWVKNEVLPTHIFYEYRRRKTQQGYCTHCQKLVEVTGARHGKRGVCPKCGKTAIFHAVGRHTHVYDRVTVQMLQKIDDELVLRICKATADYRDPAKPKFAFWENARVFLSIADPLKCDPYYFSYAGYNVTPWHKGNRPVMNRWAYHFEADDCGFLYTDNLDAVLRGTPWQYSQIKEFQLATAIPMEVIPYLRAYLHYPMLEYLVKFRLCNLAADFIYRSGVRTVLRTEGRNLKEVLGVPAEYLPLLQEIDAGVNTLGLIQNFCQNKVPIGRELAAWCQDNDIYAADDLRFCRQYVSEHGLIRYIDEQHAKMKSTVVPLGYRPFERKNQVFSQYKDYLRFCADLKYDLKDGFILYPRNLKEAHDRASEMFDKRKSEVYNEKIAAIGKSLSKQFGFRKFGMMIVAPKSASEIIDEGHALHHCVGGYVSRVANQECVILFLRKAAAPNEPFYTIELRNGEVAQIRGSNNCDPTAQVEKYMRVWKEKKLFPFARELQNAA